MSCSVLWEWNGTAVKTCPQLGITQRLNLVKYTMCNLELHHQHWQGCANLLNLLFAWFLAVIFTRNKLYFIKTDNPTEKNGPIIPNWIFLRCSLTVTFPSFPIHSHWGSAAGAIFSHYCLNRKKVKAHQKKWGSLRPLENVSNMGKKMH